MRQSLTWDQIEDHIDKLIMAHTAQLVGSEVSGDKLRGRIAALKDLKSWKSEQENPTIADDKIGPDLSTFDSPPDYLK